MTASCAHSAWCERDHTADPADPHTHEARTTVDGTGHPRHPADQVLVVVSYRDGDRAPRLYVSAEAELNLRATTELQAAITNALSLMCQVQPTAAMAVA